jgi:hypothetical protein
MVRTHDGLRSVSWQRSGARKYRISKDDLQVMLTAQNSRCAIRDEPFTETPAVDHCHATGTCAAFCARGTISCSAWRLANSTTVLWNAFLSALCAEPAGGLRRLEPGGGGAGAAAERGEEGQPSRGRKAEQGGGSGPDRGRLFHFGGNRNLFQLFPSVSRTSRFFLANYLILLARPTGIEPVFPP